MPSDPMSGHGERVDDATSAHDLLAAIERRTTPHRSGKRIALDCSDCDPSLVFHADGRTVERILFSLVADAANFSRPDGRITVSTALLSREVAAFIVTDSGIGMTVDELAVLFEPVARRGAPLADDADDELPMPACRQLARSIGGDLVATSRPDVGSAFTLVLPLAH